MRTSSRYVIAHLLACGSTAWALTFYGPAERIRHVKGTNITDLAAVNLGPDVTGLQIHETRVTDLSPAAGLPLRSFEACESPIVDFRPLANAPLTNLVLGRLQATDLSPFQKAPLRSVELNLVPVRDLTAFANAPLEYLSVSEAPLEDLSPLRGKTPRALRFSGVPVSDLSPLQGMPLHHLVLASTQVRDLDALRGMPLRFLSLSFSPVRSLEPLRGMKLDSLILVGCTGLTDLSPLAGMPLTELQISWSTLSDLTPLEGMKLEGFCFDPEEIERGIDVLRSMPSLRRIQLSTITYHSPAEFFAVYDRGDFNTRVVEAGQVAALLQRRSPAGPAGRQVVLYRHWPLDRVQQLPAFRDRAADLTYLSFAETLRLLRAGLADRRATAGEQAQLHRAYRVVTEALGQPSPQELAAAQEDPVNSTASADGQPTPRIAARKAAIDCTIELLWATRPARQYQVQWSTDLRDGGWQNLGLPLTGDGGTLSVHDPDNSACTRFYRVLER